MEDQQSLVLEGHMGWLSPTNSSYHFRIPVPLLETKDSKSLLLSSLIFNTYL